MTAHRAAVHEQRAAGGRPGGRGTLVLLTLLLAVELFWLALLAYLLYRVL